MGRRLLREEEGHARRHTGHVPRPLRQRLRRVLLAVRGPAPDLLLGHTRSMDQLPHAQPGVLLLRPQEDSLVRKSAAGWQFNRIKISRQKIGQQITQKSNWKEYYKLREELYCELQKGQNIAQNIAQLILCR